MPPKEKYTNPKLRDEVKEEVQEGHKGAAPGQWTARKAQMMASEYKKRGGDYNQDKSQKDESQENLTKWNGEGNGEDREGKSKSAKGAKKGDSGGGKKIGGEKKGAKKSAESNDIVDQADDETNEPPETDRAQEHDDEDGEAEDVEAKAGNKRTRSSTRSSANKAHKSTKSDDAKAKSKKSGDTVGSKHMPAEEPAPRGSADRLPEVGEQIQWKALPGYVDGEVVEVLTKGKQVDGQQVKASERDPKVVLKSNKSGKICVHKPEACFYD